jgi:hypothetical protein
MCLIVSLTLEQNPVLKPLTVLCSTWYPSRKLRFNLQKDKYLYLPHGSLVFLLVSFEFHLLVSTYIFGCAHNIILNNKNNYSKCYSEFEWGYIHWAHDCCLEIFRKKWSDASLNTSLPYKFPAPFWLVKDWHSGGEDTWGKMAFWDVACSLWQAVMMHEGTPKALE